MLFNSYDFLIFFPIVVFAYFLIPHRFRYIWLLIASYYFYMGWNAKYALLLLTSTVITYISGLLMWLIEKKLSDKPEQVQKYKKIVVAGSFGLNLSILFFFKYFDFAVTNINRVLGVLNIELITTHFDVLLPVGISFYIFQALSYTMDVYRGDIYPEKNFLKYALFVSFFPQLVAGPIERSKNLLRQLNEEHPFNYKRMCDGLMLMIWGYFMKLVIADRIAILVDRVYAPDAMYDGIYVLFASVLFAVQIYCDFAGYSTIALGAAKVMGFELMENFNCPYFATTVSEFWRRWHISLSSWFRDYLYIPLGGNRKGTVRKYLNTMIVFLVSGLWHGAQWSYIVWGGLNGLYQVIGGLMVPIKRWFAGKMPNVDKSFLMKLVRVVVTFVLVDFTWVFFRANSLKDGFILVRRILDMNNPELLVNGGIFDLGLNIQNFVVLAVAVLILLVADIAKYNGIKVRELILNSNIVIRWGVIILSIVSILLFGIWGSGYQATNFIYFQF